MLRTQCGHYIILFGIHDQSVGKCVRCVWAVVVCKWESKSGVRPHLLNVPCFVRPSGTEKGLSVFLITFRHIVRRRLFKKNLQHQKRFLNLACILLEASAMLAFSFCPLQVTAGSPNFWPFYRHVSVGDVWNGYWELCHKCCIQSLSLNLRNVKDESNMFRLTIKHCQE